MGCDGGTIPRRDELVRLKKKPEQKDKDAEREFRWLHCALSQQRLQEPIVMCGLGRLYSKQNIIEQLLEKDKMPEAVKHIRSMKDIKQLTLTPNPAFRKEDKTEGLLDSRHAPYICKLIGLEMSGKFRFVALWSCGCVMSERALKQIGGKASGNCPLCQKEFSIDDVIVLNACDEDLELMKVKIEMREAKKKALKREKKDKKSKEDKQQNGVKEEKTINENSEECAASTSKSTAVSSNGVTAKVNDDNTSVEAEFLNSNAKPKIVANPRQKAGNKCSLPHCRRSKRSSNVKLFRFPDMDSPLFKKWAEKCNFDEQFIANSSLLFLCDKHFPLELIGKKFLRRGAVPSLYLTENNEDMSVEGIEVNSENDLQLFRSPPQTLRGSKSPSPLCTNCEKNVKNEALYRKKYNNLFKKLNTKMLTIRDLRSKNQSLKKRLTIMEKKLQLKKSIKSEIGELHINSHEKTLCKILIKQNRKSNFVPQ